MNTEHLDEIRNFLKSEDINYTETIDKITFPNGVSVEEPVFSFNGIVEDTVELRYIDSSTHHTDLSRRFGQGFEGIPANFFNKLSLDKRQENIRVIYIKDYEMNDSSDVKDLDGTVLKNYRRKWNVLKSYICTAARESSYSYLRKRL